VRAFFTASALIIVTSTGCGSGEVTLPVYSGANALTHRGSPAVERTYCTVYHPEGAVLYHLGYERVRYESGEALIRCSVMDSDYRSGSDSYYVSQTGVTDGTCTAELSDGEAWTFSLSGAAVAATSGTSTVPVTNCSAL
jgi:hypothetical protein